MSPISASELTSIRNDAAAAACDQSCTIQRATRSTDAQGGASLTWNTVATVNVGIAEPTSTQLANYNYLVGSLSAYQVRFPVGTNVLEQDHLLVGGHTLEVVKLLNPRSYPALLTALCSEVRG